MAMNDYFYNCNKVQNRVVSDGLGGYETVLYIGIEFKGLAVQRGSTEQLIGALRGGENILYNFHTVVNMPLKQNDIIRFSEGGKDKYIRLTGDAVINTEQSEQTDWKTYPAESYTPTTVITTG